jgi:hypothetical protein
MHGFITVTDKLSDLRGESLNWGQGDEGLIFVARFCSGGYLAYGVNLINVGSTAAGLELYEVLAGVGSRLTLTLLASCGSWRESGCWDTINPCSCLVNEII